MRKILAFRAEHRKQVMPRDILAPDRTPFCERSLRKSEGIVHIGFDYIPR
jgi:hypothetical protein